MTRAHLELDWIDDDKARDALQALFDRLMELADDNKALREKVENLELDVAGYERLEEERDRARLPYAE